MIDNYLQELKNYKNNYLNLEKTKILESIITLKKNQWTRHR